MACNPARATLSCCSLRAKSELPTTPRSTPRSFSIISTFHRAAVVRARTDTQLSQSTAPRQYASRAFPARTLACTHTHVHHTVHAYNTRALARAQMRCDNGAARAPANALSLPLARPASHHRLPFPASMGPHSCLPLSVSLFSSRCFPTPTSVVVATLLRDARCGWSRK